MKRVIFLILIWGEATFGGWGEGYLPWGDQTYEVIAQLKLHGLFTELSPLSFPYTRAQVAKGIKDSFEDLQMGRVKLSPYYLHLLDRLEEEWGLESTTPTRGELSLSPWLKLEPEWEGRPENNISLTGEVSLGVSSSLLFTQGVRVEWGNWHPSWILARPWRKNLWGSTPYAYIKWESKGFYLFMGRQTLKWGPSPRVSLLLGDNPPPFDQLQLGLTLGPLRFLSLSASLDDLDGAHRYLSAHRIEVRAKRGLDLGLSEVVVYGGKERQPELSYLNPLTIYYGEQFNQRSDDNILLGVDFSWYLPRARLYGELLLDDFQYDFHSEPQEIGINGGLDLVTPWGFCLNLEYTRVNNWVYGQNKPWNRYTYQGRVIGWEMGPDADQFSSEIFCPLRRSLWTKLLIGLKRKGEGSVDDLRGSAVPWPKDFPSGVVEEDLLIGGEIGYLPRSHLWIKFKIVSERGRNRGNEGGEDFTSQRIGFEIFYRWKGALFL